MTATFTSDFHHEFEQERSRWLRRRFLWYCGVTLALSGLGLIFGALAAFFGMQTADESVARQLRGQTPSLLVAVLLGGLGLALYVWAFIYVRRRLLGRDAVLRIVSWLIIINGVLSILTGVAQFELTYGGKPRQQTAVQSDPGESDATPAEALEASVEAQAAAPAEPDTPRSRATFSRPGASITFDTDRPPSVLVGAQALANIFFSHFFACLFLPWTPRESIRPIIPLVALNALVTIVYMGGAVLGGIAIILGSPLVAAPGAAICWWRHSRFRDRFHHSMLRGRYAQMKQELTDARKIHEALFPKPIPDGDVRFDFRYQPMRQIGGDFLYIHRFPAAAFGGDAGSEALSVVIIDVTGHGIPAALTVNRLFGELERLFAEDPDVEPGEVLTALNRYVHLTLATHSVYATAICFRADPAANSLVWASGGHPPAFLRAVDGSVEQLESTSFVLGACHGADFQHGQRSIRFGPGDTLIAYTDGATEARNERGGMLRVDGLQKVIAGLSVKALATGGWCDAVIQEVDRHRFGPPADDTLVVELWRPLQPRPRAAPAKTEAAPRTIHV